MQSLTALARGDKLLTVTKSRFGYRIAIEVSDTDVGAVLSALSSVLSSNKKIAPDGHHLPSTLDVDNIKGKRRRGKKQNRENTQAKVVTSTGVPCCGVATNPAPMSGAVVVCSKTVEPSNITTCPIPFGTFNETSEAKAEEENVSEPEVDRREITVCLNTDSPQQYLPVRVEDEADAVTEYSENILEVVYHDMLSQAQELEEKRVSIHRSKCLTSSQRWWTRANPRNDYLDCELCQIDHGELPSITLRRVDKLRKRRRGCIMQNIHATQAITRCFRPVDRSIPADNNRTARPSKDIYMS